MVHQYRINFNKGEDKVSKLQRQMELGRWIVLVVFVLAAVAVGWYSQHHANRLTTLISDKQDQLQEVRDEIQHLRETGNQLSREDIMQLNELENSRLLWARKLQGLGEEVTEHLAITSVKYEKGTLNIFGVVRIMPNREPVFDVMDFVDGLNANPLFSQNFASVKFQLSERITVQNESILKFNVVCEVLNRFKPRAFRTNTDRDLQQINR
ncbi:MAG: hypothetical protein ISR91_05935 [Candidatus Delongbacteria bacterium]|nr:hypothetical protein [Candidatus Delongbacteria bacterium]